MSPPGEHQGSFCMVTAAEVSHKQLVFSREQQRENDLSGIFESIPFTLVCKRPGQISAREKLSKWEGFEGNSKLAQQRRK